MFVLRLNLILLFLGLIAQPHILADADSGTLELEATIEQYRTAGAESALTEFQHLLTEFEATGDELNRLRAERYVGECYWRLGDYPRARTHLESALEEAQRQGERQIEGKILNVLGLLEWDLGHLDEAIARFKAASAIGSELDDARLAGSTLNNLSLVYDERGNYTRSLEQYQRALEIYATIDFPRGESDTLGNIGGINLLLGRYGEAVDYYQRALAISEELHNTAAMSLDHGNLGLAYTGLGKLDDALAHFEQALAQARSAGMRKEEALWLRGKANALIEKGLLDEGLTAHRESLRTYEEIGARTLLLDALIDNGRLHLQLGDLATAEQNFQRGTEMARELGASQALTAGLLALGDLNLRRDQPEEAHDLYLEALGRAEIAEELSYQSESLLRLSKVERLQDLHQDSEANAQHALEIATTLAAQPLVAEAWFSLAETARTDGRYDTALARFNQAESSANGNPSLLWQVHYGRALTLIEQGEGRLAVAELEAAVGFIESVRERLRQDRFRAGYIQDKQQVYVTLVQLQLELGMTSEAFSSAERMRSSNFLHQLENSGPVARDEQQSQAEIALVHRIRQLQVELDKESRRSDGNRRQRAVDTFADELVSAEREYQTFLDELRSKSAIGRSTQQPPGVSELQEILQPGQALVEYVVGIEQLTIFMLEPDLLSAVSIPLGRDGLSTKVGLIRDLIRDPSHEMWRRPAASLSSALIAPLTKAGLLSRAEHLLLVPHGVLNHLPFSMLSPDPDQGSSLLIDRHELSYLPAAATLVRPIEPDTRSETLLAIAPERARLDHAQEEARSISRLFEPNSQLLTGQRATESAFKDRAGEFGIVHLSTHGYFNARNPMFSGLELEADKHNDGLLEVHEILSLQLNSGLVTLSACETGIGGGFFNPVPAGDEFVGLTRAFLLAGSRSVLATLWEVDDRSTVTLMEGFYRGLESVSQTGQAEGELAGGQARALARIQRKLKGSNKYEHPFYWAPFVLVGHMDPGTGT